jgi:hypothetical protein
MRTRHADFRSKYLVGVPGTNTTSSSSACKNTVPEQLSGDSISRIQSAMDSVNRAIDEAMRSDSDHSAQRQAARVS